METLPTPPPLRSSEPASLRLQPERVLSALGNGLRWQMVQLLADGIPRSASAVAKEFDREFDGISKHLRLLRSAGMIRSRRGRDRRRELYYLPVEYRRVPGRVDFGFCLLQVPAARPDTVIEAPAQINREAATDPRDREEEELEQPPSQGFGEMLVQSTRIG